MFLEQLIIIKPVQKFLGNTKVYPKVSGLPTWSENYKW
jgi:hypothetical protein